MWSSRTAISRTRSTTAASTTAISMRCAAHCGSSRRPIWCSISSAIISAKTTTARASRSSCSTAMPPPFWAARPIGWSSRRPAATPRWVPPCPHASCSRYELVNAQIQLNGDQDRWFLRGFVQNLFENDAITGQYLTDPSSNLFTNVLYRRAEPLRHSRGLQILKGRGTDDSKRALINRRSGHSFARNTSVFRCTQGHRFNANRLQEPAGASCTPNGTT